MIVTSLQIRRLRQKLAEMTIEWLPSYNLVEPRPEPRAPGSTLTETYCLLDAPIFLSGFCGQVLCEL